MTCWTVELLVERAGGDCKMVLSSQPMTWTEARKLLARLQGASQAPPGPRRAPPPGAPQLAFDLAVTTINKANPAVAYLRCHCPRCKLERLSTQGYQRAVRGRGTVAVGG